MPQRACTPSRLKLYVYIIMAVNRWKDRRYSKPKQPRYVDAVDVPSARHKRKHLQQTHARSFPNFPLNPSLNKHVNIVFRISRLLAGGFDPASRRRRVRLVENNANVVFIHLLRRAKHQPRFSDRRFIGSARLVSGAVHGTV